MNIMKSDVAVLQNIANTLKQEPLASQRVLADNAGISIGLMNSVLKRFVERGWIMLINVNLRKLSYAVTPEGIKELTNRSQKFARRTFELAERYNKKLCDAVLEVKNQGKKSLILYGKSYIKFLLEYACKTHGIIFIEKNQDAPVEENAFCVAGEQCTQEILEALKKQGCISLLDLIEESAF